VNKNIGQPHISQSVFVEQMRLLVQVNSVRVHRCLCSSAYTGAYVHILSSHMVCIHGCICVCMCSTCICTCMHTSLVVAYIMLIIRVLHMRYIPDLSRHAHMHVSVYLYAYALRRNTPRRIARVQSANAAIHRSTSRCYDATQCKSTGATGGGALKISAARAGRASGQAPT